MPISVSELADVMRTQAKICHALKSSLNGCLLEVLAEEALTGGSWLRGLTALDVDPVDGAVAIRLLGAFHRHALDHPSDPLARFYPSAGGRFDGEVDEEGFARCVRDLLAEHDTFLPEFVAHVPQTNEVARASGLLAGFLEIARRFERPLAILEIGSSAGLNQLFDRYHHHFGPADGEAASWGPEDAPVQLRPEWNGPPPRISAPLHVVSRASCDVAPLDVRDESVRRRLEAYVWADQIERLERLRGAMALGRESGVLPDTAGAGDWLAARLTERLEGQVTVIFHSIMWQYMPETEQRAVQDVIEAEGAGADEKMPLCWLRMEPPSPLELPEIRLRVWPGGEEQGVGHAHPHGTVYQWRGWQA